MQSSPHAEPTDVFEGTIQIGQNMYTLACDCVERIQPAHVIDLNMKIQACSPSRASIHLEHKGQGLDLRAVEANFGQARHVIFADVRTSSFQCSDDRWGLTTLATPGGEFAELLLAFSVLDSYDVVYDMGSILDEYLRGLPEDRALTLCTDEIATDHLQEELGIAGLTMLSVQEKYRKEVLNALRSPHNQGDSHLRNIARNPAAYHLSSTAFPDLLNSVLTRFWSGTGSRISLHIHAGPSQPMAILDIRESDPCTEHFQAAMMRPRAPTLGGSFVQAYILNGKAVDLRRQELAKFIAPLIHNVTEEQILTRFRSRGDEWFERTISSQLSDLPLYTVSLVED